MLQSDTRVHYTHLKRFDDSAKKYLASVEVGFESPTFHFNRLVHYLALGGVEGIDYAVYDGRDRGVEGVDYVIYDQTKTKSGKLWEAFKELHAERDIYTPKEITEADADDSPTRRGKAWERFKALHVARDIYTRKEIADAAPIADAVRNDPVVRRLCLLEGEHEKMIDWDNAGVPMRSHVDCTGVASKGERKGRRHLVDLKGTRCAKPQKFWRDSKYLTYHAQLATYEDALRTLDLVVDDAYVIAVETEYPYEVVVFQYSNALRQRGRQIVRGWLEQYRVCASTNCWPGYVLDVVDMETLEQASTPNEDRPVLNLTMHDGSEVAA